MTTLQRPMHPIIGRRILFLGGQVMLMGQWSAKAAVRTRNRRGTASLLNSLITTNTRDTVLNINTTQPPMITTPIPRHLTIHDPSITLTWDSDPMTLSGELRLLRTTLDHNSHHSGLIATRHLLPILSLDSHSMDLLLVDLLLVLHSVDLKCSAAPLSVDRHLAAALPSLDK